MRKREKIKNYESARTTNANARQRVFSKSAGIKKSVGISGHLRLPNRAVRDSRRHLRAVAKQPTQSAFLSIRHTPCADRHRIRHTPCADRHRIRHTPCADRSCHPLKTAAHSVCRILSSAGNAGCGPDAKLPLGVSLLSPAWRSFGCAFHTGRGLAHYFGPARAEKCACPLAAD
jgi:hypothetical protein